MGADFRDVDNDGRPDIFVTGMNGDTFPLFHNDGTVFSDITATSGVAKATLRRTAWGNGIVDFDNDGYSLIAIDVEALNILLRCFKERSRHLKGDFLLANLEQRALDRERRTILRCEFFGDAA